MDYLIDVDGLRARVRAWTAARSQEEFVRRSGVSPKTLRAFITGEKATRLEQLQKIRDAMDELDAEQEGGVVDRRINHLLRRAPPRTRRQVLDFLEGLADDE